MATPSNCSQKDAFYLKYVVVGTCQNKAMMFLAVVGCREHLADVRKNFLRGNHDKQ